MPTQAPQPAQAPYQAEIKKHTNAELEKLYSDAENCDSEIFPEMRSNLLLISGDHYNRRQSSFFRRIRDSKELTDQQKLRLTKNHVQKITKTYSNNIVSLAPGVGFMPKNEAELHDQKVAEQHHSVWQDAVERYKMDELIEDWADNFIGIGEVATKIFWDATGGDLLGHQQQVDDEGQPLFDPDTGAPMPGEPVYSGEFLFEEIYGFNLLRAPQAKEMSKSPYLISRKMVDKDHLLAKFPDKKQFIQESYDQTFIVFDVTKGGYQRSENQVLLKEYYFRPCPQYPKGWYYFTTKEGILHDDELPGGVYPIITQHFDKIITTPRGRSPVKTMRPYQAEINRAASKIAEHQITLGDDKLLIQNGTKISAGVALPGVRSINFTGQAPGILGGRDGSQYLAYMQAQIVELYQVMNVEEDGMPSGAEGQMDPYALLFRSASQKKKFQRYVRRFERFLVNIAKTYIKLAKIHLPDEAFIAAAGSNERVNIAEFRKLPDLSYEVKTVPQSDDIETKMGKQLVLNHLVQYTGNKLDKQDIGKIIRLMPYANVEEGFDDFTIDYDNSTNDILALDRGEIPVISQYDDHLYCIKRFVNRMRQPDFKFISPQIQQNYTRIVQAHQQAQAQAQQEIQMAEAGYIPTGGYMVACDFYVNDPQDPAKTRRARLPYEAVNWLVQKLETQGQSLDQLEQMNEGAQAQISQQMLRNKQGMAPQGSGATPTTPPMAAQGRAPTRGGQPR